MKNKYVENFIGGKWNDWIISRIKKNKNVLILVVGDTGSGKSWSCVSAAETLDPLFKPNNACFGNLLNLLTAMDQHIIKRGQCAVFEEFGTQMSSRQSLTKENVGYSKILQTFRHEGFICFFNVPDLSFVDTHARRLFHALWIMDGIDESKSQGLIKPFVLQHNRGELKPKTYKKYLRTSFKNKYGIKKKKRLKRIRIDKPSDNNRIEYEEWQKKFKRDINKEIRAIIDAKEKAKTNSEQGGRVTKINYDLMDDMIKNRYKVKQIAKMLVCSTRSVINRRKTMQQSEHEVKITRKTPLESNIKVK